MIQITIFTYDRKDMLENLCEELDGYNVNIIDDGSNYPDDLRFHPGQELHRLVHTGKKGFWKKWEYALRKCKKSNSDWFLFLPDDASKVDMDAIRSMTEQRWENRLFVCNIINDGRTDCWGFYRTGQPNIKIGDYWLSEVGFCDCGFLTNRYTLEHISIDPIPTAWFDRPDKSSGVGAQLTRKFRKLRVKMMMPVPSLCYHGDHESKMHGEHRKDTPLISQHDKND